MPKISQLLSLRAGSRAPTDPSSSCFSLCPTGSLSAALRCPTRHISQALLPKVMGAKPALPHSWLQTSPQGGDESGQTPGGGQDDQWVREPGQQGSAVPRQSEEVQVQSKEAERRCPFTFMLWGPWARSCSKHFVYINPVTLTETFATPIIIIRIFWVRKLRLGKMKHLTQRHPASKWPRKGLFIYLFIYFAFEGFLI